MAPNASPATMSIPWDWSKRQDSTSSVPTCVTTCFANANIGSCSSLTDYACLCESTTYIDSVAACFSLNCNGTEISVGEAYSEAVCAYYGVNTTAGTSTSTGTTTNTTAPIVDTTIAPQVYLKPYVKIQAIMSSICGAFLLLAIALAFVSCRARLRKQADIENRSWTGIGSTLGGDSKAKSGFGKFSRAGSSAFTNSRDATSTLASDNFEVTSFKYGLASQPQTLSVNSPSGVAGVDVGRSVNRGFTNRLTVGDMGEREEWEMEIREGSTWDHKVAEEEEGQRSPTVSSTEMAGEVDLGSTVHLNPPEKGNGTREP